MNTYRPIAWESLGAHVSGATAFMILKLLSSPQAEQMTANLPQAAAEDYLRTRDEIRAAAALWKQQRGMSEVVPLALVDEVAGSFLSTVEAGERLGHSSRNVINMIKDGRLTGKKVGGAWLVDAASVEGLAAAQLIESDRGLTA